MPVMTVEMSPTQAARALGLSRDRVRQLADAGVLASRRTPLGRLLVAEDVERLARERLARQRPDPQPAA